MCPSTEGEERKQFVFKMISVLHYNEICFFEMWKKYGKNLHLKAPKFYYGRGMTESDSGLILMEDLSNTVSKEPFTGLKFFNDEQVRFMITRMSANYLDRKLNAHNSNKFMIKYNLNFTF